MKERNFEMEKKVSTLEKSKVIATLRDAKWQVGQMKQTHFNKSSVLEILEDIIQELSKEN